MAECGVCHMGILPSDLPMPCAGCKCTKVYHYKCTSLTKALAKLVTENANVVFKCDDCLSSQSCDGQNVLVSDVKRIEEEMKKITSLADSINGIRNHIATQIDNALKVGMEQLGKNVHGALNEAIFGFQNLVKKELEIMKGSFSQFNSCKNEAAMMQDTSKKAPEPNLTPRSDRRRNFNDVDVTSDNVFDENGSFAEVVKRRTGNKGRSNSSKTKSNVTNEVKIAANKVESGRKARPVIVIKPKQSTQTNDETRKVLKSKLDPKMHKISNFRNGKDGSIIAECATGYNINVVKDGIQSKLGENYEAVVPSSVPRLKVMGMSEKFSSDDFIRILKDQNEDIAINEVKVIRMFENPSFKYNKYNVVIEVDKDTHSCLLTAKKVNIEFDRCFVVPEINVLRCFNCGEFGHMSMHCKNCTTCSKCSERHKTSECESTVLKCVNCIKMNNERKLNLDVNHGAFSAKCEIYKRLFDQKKSSLRFNE